MYLSQLKYTFAFFAFSIAIDFMHEGLQLATGLLVFCCQA